MANRSCPKIVCKTNSPQEVANIYNQKSYWHDKPDEVTIDGDIVTFQWHNLPHTMGSELLDWLDLEFIETTHFTSTIDGEGRHLELRYIGGELVYKLWHWLGVDLDYDAKLKYETKQKYSPEFNKMCEEL